MRVLLCADGDKGLSLKAELEKKAGFIVDLEDDLDYLNNVEDAEALASQAPYALILAPKGLTHFFRQAAPDIPSFDSALDLTTIYDAVTIAYGQGFQGHVVEAKLGDDVLTIDFADRTKCLKNGEPFQPRLLTKKEHQLLCAFARQPGDVLTKNHLEHQLWDEPESLTDQNLSLQMRQLRQKIGDDFIKTETDNKYSFNVDSHRILNVPQTGVHIGKDNRAYANGMPVCTTPIQFQILQCLLSSPDHIWSNDMILQRLYPNEAEKPESDGYVKSQINYLNQVFAKGSATDEHPDGFRFIENVWGQGYRLRAEPIPYVKQKRTPRSKQNQSGAPRQPAAEGLEQDALVALDAT